jgi:uncharacterized protein YjbI with pentapeptide repeats
MGTGAYMKITNNRSGAVTVAVSKVNCMYWDDSGNGSNLSLFDNATIQPGQSLPSGNPQYIESDSSGFKCVVDDSTFYLTFKDSAGNVIGSTFHLSESNFTWQTWNDVDENFFNVTCVLNASGKQFDITVDILVDPYPPGTVVNQWILSSQNRAADVWYNQDFTVYGLNTATGIPAPGSSNLVSVRDQGNGNFALECGQNYNAYASVRDDHNYQLGFQFVNYPDYQGWITTIHDREILQAVPTGDGYFALYSPHFSKYIQINPQKNSIANCNALMATGTNEISTAAKFSAAGQQRASVLDLVQLGKNAAGMSFAGANLTGINLSGANLTGCDFTAAVSVGAGNFTGATLKNAKFGAANLDLVNLAGADCTGADFTGAVLTASATPSAPPVLAGAILKNAKIQGTLATANLAGATLDGATLSSSLAGATMTTVSMVGTTISSTADLSTANLTSANLTSATLAGNLTGATLITANLTSVTIAGANLTNANLTSATLTGVNLGQTPLPTLTGANLTGVDLSKATVSGANLSTVTLAGTNFTGHDLSGVTFSSPLLQSTNPDLPTIFASCILPYAVIGLNWSCLDLTGTTLTGLPKSLPGLNASGARRPGANFTAFTLDGANFSGATLSGADFTQASLLKQVNFKGALLVSAVFTHAKLDGASFSAAALGGVQLSEAANFSNAFLSNCDFTQASLYGVIFNGATLLSGNTFEATAPGLQEADFSNAYLPGATLTGASLQGAKFDGAFMVGCALSNADLSPAQQGAIATSLGAACLQGALLDGTNLADASLDNAAFAVANGTIMSQYYDEDGQLTDAAPTHFRANVLPAAASFSNATVCPNGQTYATNLSNSLTIAQMMVAVNPPTSWEPRNTVKAVGSHGNAGQSPARDGLTVRRIRAEVGKLTAWIKHRP